MKKLICLIIAIGVFCMAGCSNISQEDYDKTKSEASYYTDKWMKSVNENTYMRKQYDSLKAEYDSYKLKMEPYEKLSELEAESKAIEAQKVIEQEKAEAEEKIRQEEAAKAAEEAQGYETGITYDNIARRPDDYKGKKVKFYGKVIQLIEGDYRNQIRFAINGNYDYVILGEYKKDIVESRILEDDLITIYGVSSGTISYKSTLGGTITIPAVSIDRIDQ